VIEQHCTRGFPSSNTRSAIRYSYSDLRGIPQTVRESEKSTVELGYNVMIWTEYCVSLQTSVVQSEEYNVVVNSEELIDSIEYLTL
jgi:hypothetical protein